MRGYLQTLNWIFKLQPRSTTVGKHKDSDLCLQNGGVEDHHATIEWNETEHCYVLSDLNSIHGTYVNDCRIHNAAVRLSPGDELHFGYGGSTYKLLVDPANPLPILHARSAASPSRVKSCAHSSSVSPHPPSRTRPASAGAKRTSLSPKSPEPRPTQSFKPGCWASSTGGGLIFRNNGMSRSSNSLQDLIQEESWVGCNEAQRKECVIAALREEISALRMQLSQNIQSDPDIRHKLANLARDIEEKKEEIQELKKQMMGMQMRSGELFGETVAEKNLRIRHLKEEADKLKSEKSKSAAMVDSLQKDLSAREKQGLKLAAEVDKLRQDIRFKDAQLSNMTNKLSKIKETEKHQEEFLAREKEVESLKKTVEQLRATVKEKQREVKQQNTERDSLKHKLEQMTKEQTSLQTEISKVKQMQQDTLHREKKVQTELRHTQTKFENTCKTILKRVLLTSETVSEEKMLERLLELAEQKKVFACRVHDLEQNLQEHNNIQRVVDEDTEKLKARLVEFQSTLPKMGLDSMQREICALRDESVSPAVSWVQTSTLSLLTSLHTLLQDIADKLLNAGIEVSETTGGVTGAIKTLCQQHQEIQSELRTLKADKQQIEEKKTQTGELQRELEMMKQELELQKLQVMKKEAEVKNTMKIELEKIRTDLKTAKRSEAALRLENETCEVKWHTKLEKAEKTKTELKEKVRELEIQEQQWRERMKDEKQREDEWRKRVEEALQKGAEEEREKNRVNIEEYREQVLQHAHTIVALEKQMSSAQQRAAELQEERDSLTLKLTEALNQLEDEKPSVSPKKPKEQQQLEETISSLRTSLGVSQQEVVRQGEVIASLSRDLAHAHARLSDLTGELSEQQKVELETHRALVVDQKMQLSMLTQKLTVTSQLLEQKDEELKKLREKLIKTEADLNSILERERREQDEIQVKGLATLLPLQTTRHTKDVAVMVTPRSLTTRTKYKGRHHEEMIRQSKEALKSVKERISAVEEKWPSSQQRVPVKHSEMKLVQMKAKRLQSSAVQRDSISSVSGFAFPEVLSEAALERTARLDLSDALELSERTYVDLARALCEALELSEGWLSGCVPLKHLPPEEREHMASLRQEDLELIRSRLALHNSLSQNKDLQLQESQKEIQTLRESQAVGKQLQAELDDVRTEMAILKQESGALHQALQDTQTQLQHCTKHRNHKALNEERMDRRSNRIGHHNCIPNESNDKAVVLKRLKQQERRKKRTENEAHTLKNEKGHQEDVTCKMETQLANLSQQQERAELTQAH
ncbi:forkhead-associated domain-containing protein 1 isoform X2 [Trichomycterus rosablanca]|uniref:forkhead-associated domain-containing protein 1 isoform X2 n=1 Tax=Trichomycterus rosablanca TaxID=2290929 RepID=UPI002F352CF7